MKKITASLLVALLLVGTGLAAKDKDKGKKKDKKEKAEHSEPVGDYAKELPDFKLKDPAGKSWSKDKLDKDGLVLVVTAPILKSKGAQEGWSDKLLDAKSGSKGKLAYIEDMQPSAFKGKALKGMKKEYRQGKEPILLIDTSGKVRKDLKVGEKQTVVLVYDGDGKLVYAEEGEPSAAAAQTIWQKLK